MRYDFYCLECDWAGELKVPVEERDNQICPDCDAPLFRNITMPPVLYKAGGFTVTDQRRLKNKIKNDTLHPILDKDIKRKRDASLKEIRKENPKFQD